MNEKDDVLVKTRPLLEIVNTSWDDFLSSDIKESEIELFRKHERNGRPLGNTTFVKQLETILDRRFRPKKPGRRKIGKASPDYLISNNGHGRHSLSPRSGHNKS